MQMRASIGLSIVMALVLLFLLPYLFTGLMTGALVKLHISHAAAGQLVLAIIPATCRLGVAQRNVSGRREGNLRALAGKALALEPVGRSPMEKSSEKRRQTMKFQTARTSQPSSSTLPLLRCCRTTTDIGVTEFC